ncbi:enoyl-[acyl-carrier-protein] reductase, mitochondrial [Plakobranchus ocellatus]|uniref:Enoyl-[acyl-carrier-protein] reductase, mitochondrial n=1 Tax=Plakobranchus ocellatus TaxID=259542 RepID=A0AAV4A304_9GAST|nr:enoyl-[acyl-carrier-protein] reductase, mitochondrial [Plakobranchus ocellatus]
MAASMRQISQLAKTMFRKTSSLYSLQSLTRYRFLSTQQLYVDKFGEPKKVLASRTLDLPASIEPRQVIIKMLMAPINPSDINMIEGNDFAQPAPPAVMGNEGVGEIIEVGSDVKGLLPGDWVIPADTAFGTWQTFKLTEDTEVIKVRNDIPVLAAATILINPCSAYRMLKDFADLQAGDVIIQNASNSAVGISVIQLAKEWGIKTINIVRNRPEIDKLTSYLKSLGADHIVTEEFCRTPEMRDLLRSLSNQPKLAFNCVGGQSASELLRHLGRGGIMITHGGMSRKPVIAPIGALIFKEIKLVGYWNTNWNKLHKNDMARFDMLSDISKLIKDSKFVPPECEIYSISDYEKAIERSTTNFKSSKVVFKMT